MGAALLIVASTAAKRGTSGTTADTNDTPSLVEDAENLVTNKETNNRVIARPNDFPSRAYANAITNAYNYSFPPLMSDDRNSQPTSANNQGIVPPRRQYMEFRNSGRRPAFLDGHVELADSISLSCVLLNARSVTNLRNANSMTAEIFIEGDFPDLIAVTETWMKTDYSNSLLPYANMYDIVRRDRSNNEKGGGVLLMIKKSLGFSHQELDL